MTHQILNDKRYVNVLDNGGFDVWQKGTTLGGTFTSATTTASSTTVSALTNVITSLRTNMTATGASLGSAKTINSLTSNTAVVLNSSSGITTATGTATVQFGVASGTYTADRWYVLSQTTGVAVSQTTGDDAKNACLITNNAYATNQRFGIAQIIAAEDSFGFRNSLATFQVRFKNSNAQPVYAAILEWSGTADSVTKNVVSDWTKTDYSTATASGKFFAFTTLAVTATAVVTPSATATWTDLTVQGVVSATANNLIVFVWTQNPFTPTSTLTLTQMALSESPLYLDWTPRSVAVEGLICRRYFERFDLPSGGILANGFSSSTSLAKIALRYQTKRVVPSASYFGLVADISIVDKDHTNVATAVAGSLSARNHSLITVTTQFTSLTAGGGNYAIDSGNATHGAIELSAEL